MLKKHIVLTFIIALVLSGSVIAQEIKIFKVEDFDLIGSVKSCHVSTAYGKEEYYFNKEGLLTKSVTRYNDQEYDGTHYKYANGQLIEKRLEHYRDDTFDRAASIATIYAIDSTTNLKITEKIVSYNNDFIDQYEYVYEDDKLVKITRSNHDGIDEILISYLDNKGEHTKTYTLNGVIEKTERTSFKKEKDSVVEKNVLIKKFIEGAPSSAVEEVYDGRNKLTAKTQFFQSDETNQFEPQENVIYSYDDQGMRLSSKITEGSLVEEKAYLYQFDANKNWIKEIVTPDNTYKTRKITYYETESSETIIKK